MAKVIAPLLSLGASGQIGSAIVYGTWRGVQYARVRVIPKTGMAAGQVAARLLITDASKGWADVAAPLKALYIAAAAGQKYSGFNLFMMDSFGKNEGASYVAPFVPPASVGDNTPGV